MRHERKFSKRYERWLAQNPPKFWPFEWMQVALTFFLIGFGIVIIIQGLPEQGNGESNAAEISMAAGQAGLSPDESGRPLRDAGAPGRNVANAEQNTQKILWKDATEFHKTDWFEQQQAKDDFAVQNFPGSPYAKAVEKMRADRELVKLPTRTENSGTTQSATASTPRLISRGLYYHYTDHLGSSNIVTDEAGNIVEATDFYPYGKPRIQQTSDPAFTNKKQFTGKEKDESGLTYFGARYYDEKLGRFTQPDEEATFGFLKLLKTPQSLNLYSYVRNNPLILVDPNGKEPKWGQLGGLGQITAEMANAFKGNYPSLNSIGAQLASLSSHFAGNRMFTRDENGNLIDAVNSQNVKRYIYTEKKGWIDMHHLFRLANVTRVWGKFRAKIYASTSEAYQKLDGSPSGWSYEDMASNMAGIEFWSAYGEKLSKGEISIEEAIEEFLSSLDPVDPEESPNYEFIPHIIDPEYTLKSRDRNGLKGDKLRELHEIIFNKRPQEMREKIQEAHRVITD